MTSTERKEFNFDVASIDWVKAETTFLFGIRRYFLKEDTMAPETEFKQLLAKDRVEYFHDLKIAFNAGKYINFTTTYDYSTEILNNVRFNEYFRSKCHIPTGSGPEGKKQSQ